MPDSEVTQPAKVSIGTRIRIATIGRHPLTTFVRAVVLAAVCWLTFSHLFLPIRVTGISMLPTYQDHAVNLIYRLAYWRHEPRRGDVVGIRLTPDDGSAPTVMYLKRIVGLPGETISFRGGRVMVNSQPLDEPYEKTACDWTTVPMLLGPTQYFVVGDNRTMSQFDHFFGKVERSRIVGRVVR